MAVGPPETFATIACAVEERTAFEREALEVLAREVGYDVAWFGGPDGITGPAPGLDPAVYATCRGRWRRYAEEMVPVRRAAIDGGGVAVDRDVLGWNRLTGLDAYQDIMRPHGGTSSALVYLRARGCDLGVLLLGRTGPTRFSSVDLAYLRASAPVLSLCFQGYAVPTPVALRGLTPREREILGYLPLGYTNAQIGIALGTSPRTVRNQLSGLFEKLGVGSRAEAAALARAAGE